MKCPRCGTQTTELICTSCGHRFDRRKDTLPQWLIVVMAAVVILIAAYFAGLDWSLISGR